MEITRTDNTIYIKGELDKNSVPTVITEFKKLFDKNCKVDLSGLKSIDSAGVAFLDETLQRNSSEEYSELFISIPSNISNAIETFTSLKINFEHIEEQKSFFYIIGEKAYDFKESFMNALYLTSDIAYWSIVGIFSGKNRRKGSVAQQAIVIGVDALPIIGLLSFIIGLILALQSAAQLRQFGANIFVADLLAVSMVREMGPMMTAIIVAGRSGSSFASEIATMKVTEELDALKMMSINPLRYVVAPKMLAITVCMPLLVTLAIIIGVLGGLVIAMTYLNLSAYSYIHECFNILTFKDLFLSLVKSVVFSWVIVVIGSFYGFQVEGGAEGVGKATTNSVVSSIFAVIVIDVIFSLIYLV